MDELPICKDGVVCMLVCASELLIESVVRTFYSGSVHTSSPGAFCLKCNTFYAHIECKSNERIIFTVEEVTKQWLRTEKELIFLKELEYAKYSDGNFVKIDTFEYRGKMYKIHKADKNYKGDFFTFENVWLNSHTKLSDKLKRTKFYITEENSSNGINIKKAVSI